MPNTKNNTLPSKTESLGISAEEVTRARQRFGIIGNSPALHNAIARALRVATVDLSVLVIGESGSGKEFFPKIIHQFGNRKHKKYIAVNCGAIPEGTIDSELFGHEKGAFTGAIASRKGYFEEADGGTIFLDEIAELPLTTQARLLRVLETGEFLKVGSSEVQKADVRVVAATNVNLLEAVKQAKFREDLYYRLSTIIIPVPNLHDRGDDVCLLARKFASDFASKYRTQPITFSPDAFHLMELNRWPGNVRQLKNIIEQLSLFHAGTEIDRDILANALHNDHGGLPSTRPNETEDERKILWQLVLSLRNETDELKARIEQLERNPHSFNFATMDTMDEDIPPQSSQSGSRVTSLIRYPEPNALPTSSLTAIQEAERKAIVDALARNNGNKQATADELDMSLRTLYRRLHELEIE